MKWIKQKETNSNRRSNIASLPLLDWNSSFFKIVCLIFCFVKLIDGNVISLKDGNTVTDWMESNFVSLTTNSWTKVTTTIPFTDPVVFLSTPLFLYGRKEYPHPLEARMRTLKLNNGLAQFEARLIFPNDSYCSKVWWTPVDYSRSLSVSWIVVEKGGYKLNGDTQLVVGTGDISGTVTKLDWAYTFGNKCNYPTQNGDNDYAPSAIFELQTSNNQNYFLNVRTTTWWYKSDASRCSYSWSTGRFFLEPHDSIPDEILYDYRTEKLGYFLFDPKQQVIDCLEGVKLQFGYLDVISDTSVKLFLHKEVNIAEEPLGVYASVLGYHGGDSVSPTSYGDITITTSDVYLFLQEDQCGDEETIHFEETSSLLIVTLSSSSCSFTDPVVTPYTSPPTLKPTPRPSTSPTLALIQSDQSDSKTNQENSGLLLALILPIIIISVIAIVAGASRTFVVKLPG